jgi:hypothetical protein
LRFAKFAFDCLPKQKGETEMVNKTNNKIVREIDKLNENEILAVSEYISQILSTRNVPLQNETQFYDDLIASLSNKRENLRARQVIEWERTRRRNAPRAA